MRKLLAQESLRQVFTHATYIMNQILRGFLVVISIIVVFQSIMIIVSMPYIEVFRGTMVIGLMAMMLYTSFQSTTMIDEMLSGEAILYLSHTLTRKLYVLSWILALCVMPLIALLLSYVIPFLILLPAVLTIPEAIVSILYAILQLAIFASMIMFLTILSRRKGIVVGMGVIMSFIIPWIMSMAIYFVPPIAPIIGMFTPFYYYLSYETMYRTTLSLPPPLIIGIASIIITIAFYSAIFTMCKKIDF